MTLRADPERWSDRELLRAIADRDGDAFTAFYRRLLPAVVSYLWRETHDPEVVADLAAEVFASVILAAHRYRPENETALPWIVGIARNVLGSSRRRGRVEDRARNEIWITAKGLKPTAGRFVYAAWIATWGSQAKGARLVGVIEPSVGRGGELIVQGPLPRGASGAYQVLITLQPSASARTPGRTVLEGSVDF